LASAWRIATFNVNGIRARLPVLLRWLAAARPQVLCLQETKTQDKDFPAGDLEQAGYQVVFNGQKSYNGVAVLTLGQPQEVAHALGDGGDDSQARFLALTVDGVRVVNTYVPQGREPDDPAFQYKLDFLRRTRAWLEARHAPDQPLIWAGDLNVAPQPEDVFDPKRLEGHTGFHPQERQALERVMSWGLTDCFRAARPDEKAFTFWDYRLPGSFKRDLGWRLDHLMATEPLARRLEECWVDREPRGWQRPSDHTPVVADFGR